MIERALTKPRSLRRVLVEAAIDAIVIGTVVVVALRISSTLERWALLIAAVLLLVGKFLVWQGRR